jgi:UDPglucose--hexose-1-phosphate uridylyltransferase
MATLRQDPTTNEWVIVAPDRSNRPQTQVPPRAPVPRFDDSCPFCPGNEHLTPPEIARFGNHDGWNQRVFPNRYPVLSTHGTIERRGTRMARTMDGVGAHEVVVESPHHDERLDEMSSEDVTSVLRIWRERYVELSREPIKAVIVFKNFGERAGTSLVHPHSQIVAMPVFPPDYLHRYAVATRYYDDTGHCVYLDLLHRELEAKSRIVAERDGFVALSPFAAQLPFEMWIVPREHQPAFDDIGDDELPVLADLLRDAVGAVRRAAGDPDYNLIVHSTPVGEESRHAFLWHLRLLPRLTTAAGFELATGMSINTVAPEQAAQLLREAIVGAPLGQG